MSLIDVANAAVTTDILRALLSLQSLIFRISRGTAAATVPLNKIVSALLHRKAELLHDGRGDRDPVILHVAPDALASHDALPRTIDRCATEQKTERIIAVIIEPRVLLGCRTLELYGVALAAGIRMWNEYLQSLSVVSPPPLPSTETALNQDSLLVIDKAMAVLGRVCDVAKNHHFDVILCVQTDGNSTSDFNLSQLQQPALHGSIDKSYNSRPTAFLCAIAVAYMATCLAQAFSSPISHGQAYPSILLSAEGTDLLHVVDLLAENTMINLSIRLAPTNVGSIDQAYVESAVTSLALLSLPGLQHIPANATSHPCALEYTRGIADLQTARLREAIASRWRYNQGASPCSLVRREFAGRKDDLMAASGCSAIARNALKNESKALWGRVRRLVNEALSVDSMRVP